MRVLTPKNCDISVKKAIQQLNTELGPDSTPTFAGLYLTGLTPNRVVYVTTNDLLTDSANLTFNGSTLALLGKMTAGYFATPVDVTNAGQYGFELHYSGNNYDVTSIRARSQLVTTDTTATAQGGLFQAANNDGINAGCLNGLLAEAIGKSTANAATISMMRAGIFNAEWGAFDTITQLNTLHVRLHSLNAAGAGSFGTGYGIYIENEAVGGNGQALNAGIYFKDTNISGGNYGYTYGIDFNGATIATADINLKKGVILSSTGAISFDNENLLTTGTLGAGAITGTSFTIGANTISDFSGLKDISGLAKTDSNIIVGNGTNWVAETGATARTSLGLGTGDSPRFTALGLGLASDTSWFLKAGTNRPYGIYLSTTTSDPVTTSVGIQLDMINGFPGTITGLLLNLTAVASGTTLKPVVINCTPLSGGGTNVLDLTLNPAGTGGLQKFLNCSATPTGNFATTWASDFTYTDNNAVNGSTYMYGHRITATGNATYLTDMYGYQFIFTPKTAGSLVYGFFLNNNGSTLNDPTAFQVGIYLDNEILGSDVNNKRWAFYNAGATTRVANKIFLGSDEIKTFWGTGYDVSMCYDGTTFNIKTDEVAASDLTITTGAAKTLVLSTVVYDDLQFQVAYAKTNPANVAPSWETFTATTSEYAFSVDDEVDTAANELPHWWKEGTAGNAHLHVTTKAINNVGVRYAKFTVTFAYADVNEVWVEQILTQELTIANPTAALTNLYLDLGDLTFTNYLIGTQVKCRIKRIAATGGTEYTGDMFITQVGIHLEKTRLGSRQEATS